MFDGKLKAVTFSYDDGVTQDIRLVELFNKYSLKGTFNLNSDRLVGPRINLPYTADNGNVVDRYIIEKHQVADLYKGHEVAVHTLTHPTLTTINDEEEIVRQVENDRLALSAICGYEVVGMAYPGGGVNNDDRVADIIKRRTGVKYARTTSSNCKFDLQDNLLRFNPTIAHGWENLFDVAEEFINLKTDTPKIFYIWGHSYEFDESEEKWERMEKFCQLISGRDDMFYGTNSQVLLKEK